MATDNIIIAGVVQADAQNVLAIIRATQSGGVYTIVVSGGSGGTPQTYAGQVNGYADGTWAAALPSASLTLGTLYSFVDEDGILRHFILVSSTAATALPGIRRASDYAGTTNERVWFGV